MISSRWDHNRDHFNFKRQSSTMGNMERTQAPIRPVFSFDMQMTMLATVAGIIILATILF